MRVPVGHRFGMERLCVLTGKEKIAFDDSCLGCRPVLWYDKRQKRASEADF